MKYDLSFLEFDLRELLKKLKKHNTYAKQLEDEIILYAQENERLKKEIKKEQDDSIYLEEKINKAIEYIEERKNLNWYAEGVFVYELLNILQGSEDNE